MRAIVDAVRRFDPEVKLFHLAGRRAQLADHAPWVRSATTVDGVKLLAKELVDVVGDTDVPGRFVIVVENVTQFADSDAERPLKELFQAINRSDHFLEIALDGGTAHVGATPLWRYNGRSLVASN